MQLKEIEIFAPATIANISCGFDVLGCCLESIGDRMVLRKSEEHGLRITKIEGVSLPMEPENNVAGAAMFALLKAYEKPLETGFELEIYKKIKPGSGIGSSAASAAGAVFALNALLGWPFSRTDLVQFAAEGERLACGAPITDNVAPALLGGFTLVQSTDPLRILELPSIKELYVSLIHPQIEIKTADARAILPSKVVLNDAVKQWANMGSLVHALHTNDHDLLAASLEDHIVEPHRSKLIPHFKEVKKAVTDAGALGCGISGSGPSIFSFSKDLKTAEEVMETMDKVYSTSKIPYNLYLSQINTTGIKIINQKE